MKYIIPDLSVMSVFIYFYLKLDLLLSPATVNGVWDQIISAKTNLG
jgi:hypothetical protein